MEDHGVYDVVLDISNNFTPGIYYITVGSYIRPHTREFFYERIACFEVSEEPKDSDFLPNIVGGPKFYSSFNWQIKKQ